MIARQRLLHTLYGLLTLLFFGGHDASAQVVGERPEPMRGVGVDPKLGAQLPLDLRFRDSTGEWQPLDSLFNGERPILLTLNYSGCPMLCRVQLDGLVQGLRTLDLNAGEHFDVVSVSLDPVETAKQAHATKMKYVKAYGREGAAHGWHFLTGREETIRQLADTVGFRYKYVPSSGEYAHAAAVMVCSPRGVVTRYLSGVVFPEQTVRLSLVEASEGKVGNLIDHFFLTCFQWDESEGRYGPVARNIMAAGGLVTVVVMAMGLAPYWLRGTRSAPPSADPTGAPPADIGAAGSSGVRRPV